MLLGSPFEQPSFQSCWVTHFTPKFGLVSQVGDFVVHPERRAKGLLRLRALRLKGWNVAWSQRLNENHWTAFDAALDQKSWDYFRLTCDTSEPALDETKAALLERKLLLYLFQAPVHYSVDLSEGWEAYFNSRSANTRKNIRKTLRQAKAFKPHRVFFEGTEGVDAFCDAFFPLHQRYWQEKSGQSYFNDPQEQAFTRAWLKQLQDQGVLTLEALHLDKTLANLSASFQWGEASYCLYTMNTGHHLELSPGVLSLYLRFQRAQEEGITTFLLGPGDYPYKRQLANHTIAHEDWLVVPQYSWAGRLYALGLSRCMPPVPPQQSQTI